MEIAKANESLVLVKLASIEVDKEKVVILKEKEVDTLNPTQGANQINNNKGALKEELDASKYKVENLAKTTGEVEIFKEELNLAKKSQSPQHS